MAVQLQRPMTISWVTGRIWMRALVTILMLVAATPLAAATDPTLAHSPTPIVDPVFSADSARLAFITGESSQQELRVIDLASNTVRTVVEGKSRKSSPSFGQDGNTLYYCDNAAGSFDIMAVDLRDGKIRTVLRTPDDEFQVICAPNLFHAGATNDARPYEKLYFLQGRSGRGSIGAVRADGSNVESLLAGEFSAFGLGGDLAQILVAGDRGLGFVGHVEVSAHAPTSATGQMSFLVGPMAAPVWASGTAGLTAPGFAANRVHVLCRQGDAVVAYDTWQGTVKQILGDWNTRVAVSPDGRFWAVVDHTMGEGYLLRRMPVPDALYGAVNLYRFGTARGSAPLLSLVGAVRERLLTNSFVVVPDTISQFFGLYEGNRYNYLDSYVTADAVYHLFHLYYDCILKELEQSRFCEQIVRASAAMAAVAAAQAERAREGEAQAVYRRVGALFTLALALEQVDAAAARQVAASAPPVVRALVEPDLAAILAATGPGKSAILDKDIDFSQFKPRGHYEATPRLTSYFRIMMLFAQMPLSVCSPTDASKPSADLATILALFDVGTQAKLGTKSVLSALPAIMEPLNFLVGESEDIGLAQLDTLFAGKVSIAHPDDVVSVAKRQEAMAALLRHPAPKIRPQSGLQVMFMPQRFTLDSYALQRLVFRQVGTPEKPRLLPRLLDVMAVLGSARAERILLDDYRDRQFAGYEAALQAVKREFAAITEDAWLANLYRGWLRSFADLLDNGGAGREPFTRSEAWTDRLLVTALGSLTTLRHDTMLYNKMGAAEAGEGGDEYLLAAPPDVYVDPYPSLYSRLRRLTLELYARMVSQGYLPTTETLTASEESYDKILNLNAKGLTLRLIRLLELLETVARKQRSGKPLVAAEAEELRSFGATLEHLTIAFMRPDEERYNIVNEEVSLVADVFTGDAACLEAAIGRVFNLWVLHDRGAGTRLYRGGVFSYYEFAQPIAERLTDKAWRDMIAANRLPPLASWMRSHIVGDPPPIKPMPSDDEADAKNTK